MKIKSIVVYPSVGLLILGLVLYGISSGMKPLDILVWVIFMVLVIALVLAAAVIGSSWHEEKAKEEATHSFFLKLDSELSAAAKLVMPENMVPPFPESLQLVLKEILALEPYRGKFEDYFAKFETVSLLKLMAEEPNWPARQPALLSTGEYVEFRRDWVYRDTLYLQSTIMKEYIGKFFEQEITAAKEWQKINAEVNIKLAEAERSSPQIF